MQHNKSKLSPATTVYSVFWSLSVRSIRKCCYCYDWLCTIRLTRPPISLSFPFIQSLLTEAGVHPQNSGLQKWNLSCRTTEQPQRCPYQWAKLLASLFTIDRPCLSNSSAVQQSFTELWCKTGGSTMSTWCIYVVMYELMSKKMQIYNSQQQVLWLMVQQLERWQE